MNKYQAALDKIKSCTNIIIDKGENYTLVKNEIPQKCFDALQELVDNYIELVNEKCKNCGDFNIITKIEPLTILCKEKECKWYGK